MKLLYICHRLPFPPLRGGKIRPFHMIRHLSRKHSVVVASLAHSQEEREEGAGLKQYCAEVIAEVLPTPVRWVQAGRALASRTPSSVAYFCSARLHRRVEEAGRRIGFDAVFVHCAFAAQYAARISARIRILDYGDLDSVKWFDYAQHRALPLAWGYGLEARKLRGYEKGMARHFDYCTLTTQSELDEFRSFNLPVPCSVIPNGVDGDYFLPRRQNSSGPPRVVFLGRMDYFPNIDGVLDFARNVFPRVRARMPGAELKIVGSNPVRKVRALVQIPGVSVTGHVADVRPYLAEAGVVVAPLRIARGTQNKILQAMAMGIPVVATPQAAKGIQAVPGRHLLVADGPEEYACRVLEVLQRPELRQKLSVAGRRQVESAHAWPLSMSSLDRVLDEVWEAKQERTKEYHRAQTA